MWRGTAVTLRHGRAGGMLCSRAHRGVPQVAPGQLRDAGRFTGRRSCLGPANPLPAGSNQAEQAVSKDPAGGLEDPDRLAAAPRPQSLHNTAHTHRTPSASAGGAPHDFPNLQRQPGSNILPLGKTRDAGQQSRLQAVPCISAAADCTTAEVRQPRQKPQTPAAPLITPRRKLLTLLLALVGQVGKALRAVAIAFCLVALLLLRPRAAGAAEASLAPALATATSISARGSAALPQASAQTGHPCRADASPVHDLADAGEAPAAATLPPSEAAVGGDVAQAAPTAALSGAGLLAAQEAAVTALFRAVQPSVVNISGSRAAGTFSTLDVSRGVPGLASGFLWDERGHVVTAYSAVRGASEVKVTLCDGNTFTAKLVGADAAKNVAVLRLSMPKARLKELSPVKLGASSGPGGLSLGGSVWAVGNAIGLDHTLTQGVVSGLGRELPAAGPYPLKGLIQTDAASAHQAGGVLVNAQGRVVGMVVAPCQAGGRAAGYGLGYALPVEAIRGLVTQILATGRPSRPTMGITLAPPQVLAAQGVEGVLVLEVPPGSPAANAGLRHTHRDIFGDLILGDVIVGLEGGAVKHAGDLYAALDARKAGERVRLDVLRDGKATSLTVVLIERGAAGALEE